MTTETTSSAEFGADRGAHADARSNGDRNDFAKKIALVVAITAGVGGALFAISASRTKSNGPTVERIAINKAAVFEPAAVPASPTAPPVEAQRPGPINVVKAQTAPALSPTGPDMLLAAQRAPVVAFARTGTPTTGAPRGSVLGWSKEERAPDDEALEKKLRPSRMEGALAGHLGNRDYVIAMGTAIPCVLETALASDQPGFATCVVNRDVLSDNGRVVLLDKGTQIVGEYRGGLKNGQSRLFVLWSRAKTPTGVIVTLGSPGTDALGRAGFDGEIDNHWWERFGSALLLSVVSDATAYGTQRFAQTNGVQINSTGQSGKQAAAIAVEQSAAIQPTLRKNQGELVSIMVGRDLDFSSVYRLRVVPPEQRSTAWEAAVAPIGTAPGFGWQSLKD